MFASWRLGALRPLARLLFARVRDETRRFEQGSAIVFAPHQDDESLACGGTIILKRRAGTPVQIVFMTDGSTSHGRFMPAEEIRLLRNQEAHRAAQKLGLSPTDLHFLDYPDGRLGACHAEAVAQSAAILNSSRPDEVFIPYRVDGTPDHEATYRIVTEAVRMSGLRVRMCEYPIWFWNQWPWVSFPLEPKHETIKASLRILRSGFGWPLLKEFRDGVSVDQVLPAKLAALEQHRSQMTALIDGVAWPTLSDVSGGEFLKCFFQKFEIFRCWTSDPTAQEYPRPGEQTQVAQAR
jgi:LmbE family N-acetylglucosaminyl deacetylase